MDHLPLPKSPVRPPIEVPYYEFSYDGHGCIHDSDGSLCNDCATRGFQGWHYFPNRMGWHMSTLSMNWFSRSQVKRDDNDNNDDNYDDDSDGDGDVETIAMLQSWLWFGLLHAFFEQMERVNANDFLSSKGNDDSSLRIDTSALPALLSRWKQWIEDLSSEQRNEYVRNVRGVLQEVSYFTMTHFKSPMSADSKCPLPQEIQLSIAILGDTLHHAVCTVMDDLRNQVGFGVCKLIEQRLRDDFWCPTDIAFDSVSVAYFVTMMSPRSYQTNSKHERCRLGVCYDADIVQSDYQIQHATEDCKCEHFGSPTDLHLRAILDQNRMLLFTFEAKFGVDAQSLGYVAISHVWADGLGNPSASSLPICQLKILQDQVNALYGLQGQREICVPFFMDTLCIPVVENATDEYGIGKLARKVAISWMSKIYSEASRVLVLDQDVRSSCNKETDTVELFTRLSTSRWAHRLWTLHEAALSTIIFIQLSDGAVRLADLMDDMGSRVEERPIWDPITYSVGKWGENLSRLRHPTNHDESELDSSEVRIINAFICASTRSTSHKEDEVAILALLAGFDVDGMRTLLDYPTSELESQDGSCRSTQFLNTIGKIPKHLLLTSGQRCRQSSRRACPVDLLDAWRDSPGGPHFAEFHEINAHGVQGTWDGLRIKSSIFEHFDLNAWKTDSGVAFPIKNGIQKEWQLVGIVTTLSPEDVVRAASNKFLVILSDADGTAMGGKMTSSMLVVVEHCPPPLQQEGENDVKIVYAHWVSYCIIHSIEKADQDMWEFSSTVTRKDHAFGEPMESGQVWCID